MDKTPFWRIFYVGVALIGVWLGVKYALPVLIPFLLGGAVALGAEPMVRLLDKKAHLPRWLASGVGVSLVLLILLGLLMALLAFLAKQTVRLSAMVPQLVQISGDAMQRTQGWMRSVTARVPGALGATLTQGVDNLFSGSSAMVDGILDRALSLASRILSGVTNGFFGTVTGILAAYMISARLPQLRLLLGKYIPQRWRERMIPELRGMGRAVWGWVWAQIKLAVVAFGLMAVGFFVLKIPYGIAWAAGIALVDAFPILGCGTVLIPWSIVCFLQGQQIRAVGLLAVYVLVWLVRSVLEPRMVGKELGLDALVTLISVYAGLKLFGFLGMLLAPILVMMGVRAFSGRKEGKAEN